MTLPEGPVPTSRDGQPIQQPAQPAPQSPYSPYSPPYGAASGYPPLPQGGYTPTDSFVPPATLDPRYGRIGRVPWTFGQTLLGAAITIVPWMAFLIATEVLSSGSSATLKPLPPLIDLTSGIIAFLFTGIVEGIFLLAPLYYAVWHRQPGTTARDGFRALGFRKTAFWPAASLVIGGIVISLAFEVIYGLIVQQLNLPLQTNADRLTQQAHYAPFTIFFTMLAAVIFAPLCEEVFFRGYLFAGLLQGMNVWLATLVSALLFTLVHGDIGSAVPLFIIGLVLPVLRWRTGSLWPGIALHVLNNLLALLTVLQYIRQ